VVADAVWCEPVSVPIPCFQGKQQGNFRKLGLKALSEPAFVRKLKDIEMVSLPRKTGNSEKVSGNFLWLIREVERCAAMFMRRANSWTLSCEK
jgi:hypothetical protein